MDKAKSNSDQLSKREQEIAVAFASGENYQQIAERLCLAPSTVRTHLTTIYRKLGVSSKLELHKYFDELQSHTGGVPASAASRADMPSIAVLAFENMSGEAEQEYFSDGITEDIITALSRSPWLFIIARNTTFTYKGQNVDVQRVATELGVRYVLEGSVRRAGDRIRISAQLIDGTTGGHVWSERYDRQLVDVFDLQDEITRNVVASVLTRVHLTASDQLAPMTRRDLTVWDLTMQAWRLLYEFSSESYRRAEQLLEQAIARDPNSAEAHLVLSLIHHHTALMGSGKLNADARAKAYQLGQRATQLDENNEYAHWAYGISCFGLHKHNEAIPALQRAVELNPNCSVAYGSLGTALSLVGRVDEGIENQEIAIRSNPRDPSIFFRFTGLSLAHYLAGRFEQSSDWAAQAVQRMPSWYFGHFMLIASLSQTEKSAETEAAVEACLEALPDVSLEVLDHMPLQDPVEMDSLRSCLRRAGIPE